MTPHRLHRWNLGPGGTGDFTRHEENLPDGRRDRAVRLTPTRIMLGTAGRPAADRAPSIRHLLEVQRQRTIPWRISGGSAGPRLYACRSSVGAVQRSVLTQSATIAAASSSRLRRP